MSRRIPTVAALLIASLLTGLPASASAANNSTLLAGFPTLRQQHALTCESSAASMATRGIVTEGQLMQVMPRNPNPNIGFRGNPDGVAGKQLINYGVYAAPVREALLKYGYHSDVLMYQPDQAIIDSINRGYPVVAWITYQLQKATPRLATWNGEQFVLVPHEHAVLIVGYEDGGVIVNDPWTKKTEAYDWNNFNRAWGYFGRMALSVEPCPLPQPVTGLRVASLTAAAVTWRWQASKNADHYAVKLFRADEGGSVVWSGNVAAPVYKLVSPVPGAVYEISVQPVSACSGTRAPSRLWAQLPATLGTPVEATVVPSVTPVPAGTAVATLAPATPGTTPTP